MENDAYAYIVTVDGHQAKIIGNDEAVAFVVELLQKAGANWRKREECWDMGFYSQSDAA